MRKPAAIWPYIKALLYFKGMLSCLAIAEAIGESSHDQINRMLRGDWSAHSFLGWAFRFFFRIEKGWLSLDDTVLEKPHARKLQEAAWVYSNTHGKPVFGINVVMLVWSNGTTRIPLGYRVWKKGGKSKIDLGLELLSHARNRLKLKPELTLFDSWYSSERLLKRLNDYGWAWISRLKNNRKFNGKKLKHFLYQPYWNQTGKLSGGIKVFVVRHGKKFFATNRLGWTAKEVRRLYKRRQDVEEVFKILKSELGLSDCQVGSCKGKSTQEVHSQEYHVALCILSYWVIEKGREDYGLNWRKMRRQLIIHRDKIDLPVLHEIMEAA